MRELIGRLHMDLRDRSGERDPLGRECDAETLRHVAVLARHRDPGKAAPLDLARDLQSGAPPAWRGDQVEGGQFCGY